MSDEQDVRDLLARLPSPPMPPAVRQQILARLAEQQAPVAPVVPITRIHRRRLNGLLIAAVVAAFAMLMSVTVQSPSGPVTASPAPVIKAGALYQSTDFVPELQQRFRAAPAAVGPTRTFADSRQGIQACTVAVDAYGSVLSVDTGSYDDVAAVVLVTTYLPDTQYEEVWVVTPRCGPGDDLVMRHMVYDVDNSTANL